ncbi:HMG box-containing protein 1 isoform X1 [Pongo pygmaeus]|uniref:HMG box-containing protein 1 isoform X4 n=1 Tax=Pongo abelii TaxID=9601 RepID=UPI0004F4532A|nr:HMG box-containing protein 1 isoform X9 [Pongo abelii]XP_054350169.1 HMG box-containing protein 1 isoform X1 [Pongo pygmaeus]XP_054350170.1 HMG box-containing protein 1 isoform X1 [Pongo pygmaeus]XP_054350171.1 HMG box-containing protein 1 isoform X1 [Pongo pygmaeus]XP_054350172.1 HMG box-containing protein 1 isoform X1 [Pongo pygmaeus]XP_054350173.1 HMG box-containing protein 1 isoform X1 [Pongo pygmaeus]XP_054350174.1 HMG box-containing protein 1 isoform X1 [Pongo pygmaeus]XP_054350175.
MRKPKSSAEGGSEHHNMVWEVKTNQMPNAVQKLLLVMDKRASGMNDSLELLQCNENLPSSPGYNSCDEHMELDDLPELQAVQSDPTQSGMYQLSSDVSHQEYPRSSWNQNTSDIPETTYRENEVDWLTELANIATSPQSPLMQCSFYNRSSPVHIIATSKSLHSYARPPPVSSSSKSEPAFPHHHWKEETPVRHERANSESESGIFCMSSLSDDDDLGWCNSWPSTVWHCFLKGTRLCFHKGSNKEWQDVEDFARAEGCDNEEDLQMGIHKGYGSDGLKLLSHEESVSFGESVLKLTFDPGTVEDGLLTVECKLDHPFYVKNKGWSSFYPSLTVVQHGIPCCEVHIGDVCLPPGHPDAINFDDSGVFDTFKSYDFTPMDSSAVYVLSSMARQRRASLSCGGPGGQDFARSGFSKNCGSPGSSQLSSSSLYAKAVKNHSSGTVSATSPNKCKRPMNAFMLFAKKYRVEYTQMYPGKDNRAISVILGDRWKKMKNEERRMYTLEAKALAEEQKRLNPDCWKRKRTNSGSQQH